MPYPTIPPKRSLGIFAGLQGLLAQRQERQEAERDRQQKIEDRVFGSIRQGQKDVRDQEMFDLNKQTLEQRLADMKKPKPVSHVLKDVGTDLYDVTDPTHPHLVVKGPEKPKQNDPYGGRTREQWLKDESDKASATRPPKTGEPAQHAPAEFEKKAAFMLEGAEGAVKTLEGYVPKPRSYVSKVPGLGNYGITSEDQVAQQAAETLHDAYLRLTTGATINKDELARAAKQYIAQPGDDPAVLQAKKTRREQIIRALRDAASTVKRPGGDAAPPKAAGVPSFEEWKARRGGTP